jgi:transposase
MAIYPDLTDAQWQVLELRVREVMRELTIAVGRPMVHDLRAMCDAVAYVVKNGVEWAPCPSISPRGRRRRRSSSGGPAAARPWRWLPGCGSCCCARARDGPRSRRPASRASQMIKRTTPSPGRPAVSRRQEDHRPRTARCDRCGGLAARPGRHRPAASDTAGAKLLLIRLFDAFSTLRIIWADTGDDGAPLARYAAAAVTGACVT